MQILKRPEGIQGRLISHTAQKKLLLNFQNFRLQSQDLSKNGKPLHRVYRRPSIHLVDFEVNLEEWEATLEDLGRPRGPEFVSFEDPQVFSLKWEEPYHAMHQVEYEQFQWTLLWPIISWVLKPFGKIC